MEIPPTTPFSNIFLSIVAGGVLVIVAYFCRHRNRQPKKLPPGPYSLPFLGNIFQIRGGPLHSTLTKLSQKYGPLMTLKLGGVTTTIVVSSPKYAKEVLRAHDQNFIQRTVVDATRVYNHHKFSLAFVPVEDRWRNLRKLCKDQLFSLARMNGSEELRLEKAKDLINYLDGCSVDGAAVDIFAAAFTTSLNFLSQTMFSLDFGDFDSKVNDQIREWVSGTMRLMGTPNISDFLPFLSFLDPQGIRRQTEVYVGKLFDTFYAIFSQRLEERTTSPDSPRKPDLLEVLIDLCQQNDSEWSFDIIRHLLLDLFLAGTNLAPVTVEWAMTELLKNPEEMNKVRTEIQEAFREKKLLTESDIFSLPYLQAVVKETFRLHPTASILLRQLEDESIEIDGYTFPKHSQIIVNMWAIGRDSNTWENPNSFQPERFLSLEKQHIDVKGRSFELLPFGTGRRICIGMPLAHRMVYVLLASLIQNYDWKLEKGMLPENIGTDDFFGFASQKLIRLKAIPVRIKP